MSTSIQIAEFFARIGIKADTRQLDIFLDQMKQLNAYSKQLRSTLKNSFKVRTDYSNLPQMRNSLGATLSSVRALRAEIGRLRSTNVTANVGATVNRRGNFGAGGGQGGGGGSGGRVGFMDGALSARGMISAGLAPVAATAIGVDVVRTSMQVDAAKAALLSISDSAADAQQQFQWLRAEADRLGFVFLDNARNYTNFVAAGKSVGIGAKQVQTIFSATAKYGRVLGLSNDDLTGTFRALQQMMSKGTVQSEELKGQLGERLPGAVGMAAKAMGVTTEELFKMLQNGEVLAKDLLPKLAVEMEKQAEANGAFAASMKMTGAQLNQFLNKWNDLKDAFARSGFLDAVINGIGLLAVVIDKTGNALKGLSFAFGAFSEFLEAVFNPAVLVVLGTLGLLYLSFTGLLPLIGATLIMMSGIILTATIAAAPFIAWAAGIALVVAVVEDLYVAMTGGDSQFKEWAKGDGVLAGVARMFLGIADAVRTTITNIKELLILMGIMDEAQKPRSITVDPKAYGNITDMALGTGLGTSMVDSLMGGSQVTNSSVMTDATKNNFNNTFTVNVMGGGDPDATGRAVKKALDEMVGTTMLSFGNP